MLLLLLPPPCGLWRMQVATQFFTLQVVTVFFASFITGSLLNQLALLVTNPQQVLTILGTGEPGNTWSFPKLTLNAWHLSVSVSLSP